MHRRRLHGDLHMQVSLMCTGGGVEPVLPPGASRNCSIGASAFDFECPRGHYAVGLQVRALLCKMRARHLESLCPCIYPSSRAAAMTLTYLTCIKHFNYIACRACS